MREAHRFDGEMSFKNRHYPVLAMWSYPPPIPKIMRKREANGTCKKDESCNK
jgi:hypothetical protein